MILSTNCVLVYLPVIVKYKVAFQSLSPLAFLHVSILIQFFIAIYLICIIV